MPAAIFMAALEVMWVEMATTPASNMVVAIAGAAAVAVSVAADLLLCPCKRSTLTCMIGHRGTTEGCVSNRFFQHHCCCCCCCWLPVLAAVAGFCLVLLFAEAARGFMA